jgi:hypothetical protein
MSHARPARYDAMCHAISAAHAVDEVKAIRDKAAALELYARHAGDRKWEQRCREIRERAQRRWSQLYTPQLKARGAREKGVGKHGNGAAQQTRSPEVTALRRPGRPASPPTRCSRNGNVRTARQHLPNGAAESSRA